MFANKLVRFCFQAVLLLFSEPTAKRYAKQQMCYEVPFKWFVLPIAGLMLKYWPLYKLVGKLVPLQQMC